MARTLGVEEEMILLDRSTFAATPKGEDVAGSPSAGEADGVAVDHEFKLEQVETATPPRDRLEEVRSALVESRRVVAARSAELDCVPAAVGTSPVPACPTPTPGSRYARMLDRYGELAREQLTCGMHVHVAIASREEGVGVLDRVRPWLPLLLAVSASSPFWRGADSKVASFRTLQWGSWPTAGPTEVFGSADRYDDVVARLVETGAALDEGMVYFHARLSRQYPTVEVRIADVCPRVEDALLVAALSRGLVETAARDWERGEPPPPVPGAVLRAATWQAARSGLEGDLPDPRTLRPVPVADALGLLVDHVAGALADAGDLDWTREGVARVLRQGTSARRQREVYARTGSLVEVARAAVAATTTLPGAPETAFA